MVSDSSVRIMSTLFSFQGAEKPLKRESGDYSEEATPVPIPNTAVKLFSADDTWREAARESRTSPVGQGTSHARCALYFYMPV